MLQISDIGKHIKNGHYNRIHSRFTDVVNFHHNDEIGLSVVNRKIGGGPFNIVIDNFDPVDVNSVELNDDFLIIDPFRIELTNSSKTNYCLPEIFSEIFLNNFSRLKDILIENCPKKSLAVFFDDERKRDFHSTFEKNLLAKYREAIQLFENNVIQNSVKIFRGLGFGLTPSGDDFNAGILMGLSVAERLYNSDRSLLKNNIFETAKGENHISNLLLYICKNGLCTEKFKEVLMALSGNDLARIECSVKNYISIGETSGADFLTGFYYSVKKELETG